MKIDTSDGPVTVILPKPSTPGLSFTFKNGGKNSIIIQQGSHDYSEYPDGVKVIYKANTKLKRILLNIRDFLLGRTIRRG